MIHVISGKRCTGKTKNLLLEASKTGGTVICKNPSCMEERALQMGITNLNFIPYDWVNVSLPEEVGENIYIDEVESFLSEVIQGRVEAFTVVA